MNRNSKPVCLLMAIIFLFMAIPDKFAPAAMIATSAIADASQVGRARMHLKQTLTRQDVQDRLAAWGISQLEAAACIDNLTDAEIQKIAAQIGDLPSGGSGGAWGVVGIAMVAAFIILLITDLLGYTDFFNIR